MLEKISLAGSIMFRDGSVDVLCMEQLCLDHFIDDVSIFFQCDFFTARPGWSLLQLEFMID